MSDFDASRSAPMAAQAAPNPLVPASNYFSKEYAELENERLWPRIWQMVCREEEIPSVGDFHTYEIVDESIVIIRTAPDEIKAFYNVCPHRGRRLITGCGHASRLQCRFHGWQFDLDGRNVAVVDREDWGDTLTDADLALKPVKVGRWSGWVYINMDPASESLEEALSPAKAFLDPFNWAGLRYYWRKSTILPCNWKIALEAFNEGYHLQQVHRQMLRYFDDVTESRVYGRHSMFGYWGALKGGWRSRRLGGPKEGDDLRAALVDYMEDMLATLNAAEPINMVEPARRLMAEVAADASEDEVFARFGQFAYEHAVSQGIEYPPVTPEQMDAVGNDWHIFPNHIILPGPTAVLSYRARPNGHDPDTCRWDVYALRRYPVGKEPPLAPTEWSDDIGDESFWGKILVQDFVNFADMQRGVKSRAFTVARTNPVQEMAVANLHRGVQEFIDRP
jgi:nitrite reductase/ring-hydroxylating ferredoxin subunit